MNFITENNIQKILIKTFILWKIYDPKFRTRHLFIFQIFLPIYIIKIFENINHKLEPNLNSINQ